MPRIRMLYPVIGEDHEVWEKGTVHAASERYARLEVHLGRAELVGADASPTPPLTTQSLNRMAVPETRDPAPSAPARVKGRK